MANEVRAIVEQDVMAKDGDVDADWVQEMHPEFDYRDIISAMKQMETDKLGVMALGRKGKATRFIKDAYRQSLVSDRDVELLRVIFSSLEKGTEVSLGDPSNFSAMVNDVAVYTAPNRATLIDFMKAMDRLEVGTFIIGRKGKVSRFMVGMTRAELVPASKTFIRQQKPKAPPKEKEHKYNVLNGILFEVPNGVHETLEAAMNAANIDDSVRDEAASSVSKLGFYKFA